MSQLILVCCRVHFKTSVLGATDRDIRASLGSTLVGRPAALGHLLVVLKSALLIVNACYVFGQERIKIGIHPDWLAVVAGAEVDLLAHQAFSLEPGLF